MVRSPVKHSPESSTSDTLSSECPGVGTTVPGMPIAASNPRDSSQRRTTFPSGTISV